MQVIAVPVKALDRAKGRLAPVLSPSERADLTMAMFGDVLDAALAQPGWDVWVVSASSEVLETASARGAAAVVDRAGSLRGAVREVEAAARAADPDASLAVVLADLPRITAPALACALGVEAPVAAVAASGPDGGTNVLVRRPADVVPNRFGRSSFQRHRDEARRAGVGFVEVGAAELAFDLDTPRDLASALSGPPAGRAWELLRRLDVRVRLAALATG